MTTESKIRTFAALATALLVISLFTSVFFFRAKNTLSDDLRNERLNSERLLGEKSYLEKTIEDFKNQLASLKGSKLVLNNLIKDTENKLKEKEAFIKRLKIENATVQSLKRQMKDINELRKVLIAELNQERINNKNFQQEKDELNQMIASLQEENQKLNNRLVSSTFIAKNFRTEVVKGKKNKLTVKAKRADKIIVSFDLPENGQSDFSKLHLNVSGLSGKDIKGKITFNSQTVETTEQILTASINEGALVETKPSLKRLTIDFEPEEDLKQGIYKIVVFDGNVFLGSTQIRLGK